MYFTHKVLFSPFLIAIQLVQTTTKQQTISMCLRIQFLSAVFPLLFFWLRLLHVKYCIGHFITSTCTFNESEELYDVRAEMGNNKIGLENGPTLCVWWIKMNIKKFISSKIFDFIAMECLCNWFCMFTKLISTSRAYEQQTKSLHTNISFMVLSVF